MLLLATNFVLNQIDGLVKSGENRPPSNFDHSQLYLSVNRKRRGKVSTGAAYTQ